MDGITNSVVMNLSKLQQIVKDRESWHAAVHGVAELDRIVTVYSNSKIVIKSPSLEPRTARFSRCRRAKELFFSGSFGMPALESLQFWACRPSGHSILSESFDTDLLLGGKPFVFTVLRAEEGAL